MKRQLPPAIWPISIGLLLIAYVIFDRAVLRHSGQQFLPYTIAGLERTHAALLGAALVFMGYAITARGARRVHDIGSKFDWRWAAILVVAFASLNIVIARIQADPFGTTLWQEYADFILGRRPENFNVHPLFHPDTYVPPLYLLPVKILNSPLVQVSAVALCWITPPVVLLFILRRLEFDALTSALIVMLTVGLGQRYLQEYMLAPQPFTYYDTIDFRMTVIPSLAFMAYFIVARHHFIAGLFAGFALVSHLKFGFRAWMLTTFVFGALAIFDHLRGRAIDFRALLRFQIGFLLVFAGSLWSVLRALHAFDHVSEPRATEVISSLGWMIKNEPDDWLLLFQPKPFMVGVVLLAVGAIVVCLWLARSDSRPNVQKLALIGLAATGFAVFMLALEVIFEKWGLSLLPWQLSLAYLLNRPWDFLWVPPLSLALAGGAALLYRRTRGLLYYTMAISIVGAYFAQQIHDAVAAPGGPRLIAPKWQPPAAIVDYSVLTICSPAADEHRQARADATAALMQRQFPEFEAAIARMRSAFRSAVGEQGSWPRTDLEADNLVAIRDMREGRYAAAFANLRAQDREIQRVSPQDHPWPGDIDWFCAPGQKPGVGWRTVVLPWDDFDEALGWIARHVPAGTGVIQPPSLPYVVARSDHPSFWQTKSDSHLMYLYSAYYGFGLNRLNRLAGPGALEYSPGFRFGDPGERARKFYRALTAEDFSAIQHDYAPYRIILVEADQTLDLPLLFSNHSFAVYECCSERDRPSRK
jgi:hypothetical protein